MEAICFKGCKGGMRGIQVSSLCCVLLLFFLSLSANADTPTFILGPAHSATHPWSLEVGVGYGQYEHLSSSGGTTALARLGIGKELVSLEKIRVGLETAFQSGSSATLNIPPDIEDDMGGLPVDTTFQSTLDFLVTGKFYPSLESSAYVLAKCGVVLRKWSFGNRGSIPDLTRFDPELMIGGGYDLTHMASLSLSYQRMQGESPTFTYNAGGISGSIADIPSENALILGLSIYFI